MVVEMSQRDTVAILVKLGRANAFMQGCEEVHRLSTLATSIGYIQACKDMANWMNKEMVKPAPDDLVNTIMDDQK